MSAENPLRNAKHEAVLQAYFADPQRVGYKAYLVVYPKSSGPAAKTAFSRLLKAADFAARLKFLDGAVTSKVVENTAITIERTVSELAKIGFASAKHYLSVSSEGDPVIDLSELSDDQYAALAEVTVEDFVDGRAGSEEILEPQAQGGELRRRRGRDVRRVKFRLHNKQAALVSILDHLGGFPARKHELTGAGGGPIEHKDVDAPDMSERELGRRILFTLERAARAAPAAKPAKKPTKRKGAN
jgi:hypothetical protein